MSNGQDWFSQNAPKQSGGDWFAANAPAAGAPKEELAPPDTSGEIKKRRALTVGQVAPFPIPGETAGGIITSPFRAEKAEEIAKGPGKQFEKDLRTGALSMAGAGVGGAAVEGLVPGAKAAAGGSKLLKFLLPALVRGSGAGAGAGAGTLAAGGTPKEALGTAAAFTGAEVGMEGVVKGAGKLKGFAKDVLKSKVTRLEEEHAAKAAEMKIKHEEELQAHKQKLEEIESRHKAEVEDHKQKIKAVAQMEEQKAVAEEAEYQKSLKAHQDKVSDITQKYAGKVQKFKDAESLKTAQKELGTTVGENIKQTEKQVAREIGGEFDRVSEAVEEAGPVPKVTDATKLAKSEIIFPDSGRALANIVKNLGETIKVGNFSEMRQAYSKLNEVLYGSGELPRDLYKAVRIIRDSLGKDLTAAAKSVGEGDTYAAAMKKYAKFMDDFHDSTSLAKGGSPIARIIQAEDPAFVVDQFGGKASDRLMKTLGEYESYGANTKLAKNLKDATDRLKSMSLPKEMPGAPKIPAAPERQPGATFTPIPTPPQAPGSSITAPAVPPAPQAPQIPPFDREAVSRQQMVDLIRKALIGAGAGVGGAYAWEKLFGGNSPTHVP
jgi:hypothetical protein